MNERERWRYYRGYGLRCHLSPERADDFAQECFIRFLQAGTELRLSYVYVDFMRSEFGRIGANRGKIALLQLTDKTDFTVSAWERGEIEWPELDERETTILEQLIDGVTQKDIAELHGITPPRVSQ